MQSYKSHEPYASPIWKWLHVCVAQTNFWEFYSKQLSITKVIKVAKS